MAMTSAIIRAVTRSSSRQYMFNPNPSVYPWLWAHAFMASKRCWSSYVFLLGTDLAGWHAARQEFNALSGATPLLPDFAWGTWFTYRLQRIYNSTTNGITQCAPDLAQCGSNGVHQTCTGAGTGTAIAALRLPRTCYAGRKINCRWTCGASI